MKKLFAVLSLAALTTSASVAFAAGAEDYKAKCAMCHGADGAGAMAKKMGSRDLNSADVQAMGEADIAKVISEGKGKMTGFKGKLTDDQIKAVAEYVKTLKK